MSRNNSRSLNMPLQIRRGTNAQRQAMTQALAQGELLYVTDDQRLYIGNGSTLGGVQITGYTDEDAQDAAAQLFTNGAPHTGITFAYNDAGAGITAVVDLLNNTGTIGGVFKGNVVAEDSTLLIDAASGQIVGPVFGNVTGNLTGNVTGNADTATVATSVAITATNSTAASHFITFVDTATGNENLRTDTALTYNPSTDTLTSGTFSGNVVGNTFGVHTGDVIGSVFADNSSLMVDAVSNTITASTVFTSTIDAGNDGLDFLTNSPDAVRIVGIEDPGINQIPSITLESSRGVVINPVNTVAGDLIGVFKVQGYHTGAYRYASGVITQWSASADFTQTFPRSNLLISLGNNSATQTVTASLSGDGIFVAGALQTGVYVTTPSDTRPTPAKGMIIFNDTAGVFQGYNGAAWVNLN